MSKDPFDGVDSPGFLCKKHGVNRRGSGPCLTHLPCRPLEPLASIPAMRRAVVANIRAEAQIYTIRADAEDEPGWHGWAKALSRYAGQLERGGHD